MDFRGAFGFFAICAVIVLIISASSSTAREIGNQGALLFVKIITYPVVFMLTHPIAFIAIVIGFFIGMEWWHRRP